MRVLMDGITQFDSIKKIGSLPEVFFSQLPPSAPPEGPETNGGFVEFQTQCHILQGCKKREKRVMLINDSAVPPRAPYLGPCISRILRKGQDFSLARQVRSDDGPQ